MTNNSNTTTGRPTVKNNCFQVSSIRGINDSSTTFVSDLSKLKFEYVDGMQMKELKLCGSESVVNGIQGLAINEESTVSLTEIGNMINCDTWRL